PAPVAAGAAQTPPRTHRRSGQELEVLDGRSRGAWPLEGLHERVRGLPERDEHPGRPVVCGAGRRQEERPAHYFWHRPADLAGVETGLPEGRREAPCRVAPDPFAAEALSRARRLLPFMPYGMARRARREDPLAFPPEDDRDGPVCVPVPARLLSGAAES